MRYIIGFIAIVLLAGCNAKPTTADSSNNPTTQLPLYPYDAHFSWGAHKKQNHLLVQQFMKVAKELMPSEYMMVNQTDDDAAARKKDADKFMNSFTVVDFNGDGLDDLVYTGDSGGEPQEVAFILNTGKGFKVVFREDQQIDKLDFENGKVANVYLVDGGCCEDYITFCKIYHVDYNGAEPTFKNVYTTATIHGTDMPKSFFKKPIYFEVLNDNYKMRFEPFIQDTKRGDIIPMETLPGNTIDTLVRGTRGRAIGAHTDKTGRVWWLAEIDRGYDKFGNYFYGQQANMFYKDAADTTHKAARIGWVSSRYVKVLND